MSNNLGNSLDVRDCFSLS